MVVRFSSRILVVFLVHLQYVKPFCTEFCDGVCDSLKKKKKIEKNNKKKNSVIKRFPFFVFFFDLLPVFLFRSVC